MTDFPRRLNPCSRYHEFRIRASGTAVEQVFPNIALRVDGRVACEGSLRREGWQTVVLAADLTEGEHDIGIAFTNDLYRPPEDRNLTIASLEIVTRDTEGSP